MNAAEKFVASLCDADLNNGGWLGCKFFREVIEIGHVLDIYRFGIEEKERQRNGRN
jgi:hypothetical protein